MLGSTRCRGVGGGRSRAVAIAARPSPRPVRPRPSVVVPDTETGPPAAAESTCCASARRVAIRGRVADHLHGGVAQRPALRRRPASAPRPAAGPRWRPPTPDGRCRRSRRRRRARRRTASRRTARARPRRRRSARRTRHAVPAQAGHPALPARLDRVHVGARRPPSSAAPRRQPAARPAPGPRRCAPGRPADGRRRSAPARPDSTSRATARSGRAVSDSGSRTSQRRATGSAGRATCARSGEATTRPAASTCLTVSVIGSTGTAAGCPPRTASTTARRQLGRRQRAGRRRAAARSRPSPVVTEPSPVRVPGSLIDVCPNRNRASPARTLTGRPRQARSTASTRSAGRQHLDVLDQPQSSRLRTARTTIGSAADGQQRIRTVQAVDRRRRPR